MDIKDWLAFGSLLVSAVALCASAYSVVLAKSRDRREVEATKPRIDIEMPCCDGRGPWMIRYTMKNKSDDPIVVESIGLLAFADGGFRISRKMTCRGELRFVIVPTAQWLHVVNTTVAPEDTFVGSIEIEPKDGKQLRDPVPLTFFVEASARNAAETRYRWRIKRIATPDKITATT